MKKGLLFSCIALAMFIVVSVAGADVKSRLQDAATSGRHYKDKSAQAHLMGRAIDARSYRSPSGVSKVVIAADDAASLAKARASGAAEVADYGSFRLLAIPQLALDGFDSKRLTVRDDFNVLYLRSGAMDTTTGEAAGTYFGMGRAISLDRSKFASAFSEKPGRLRLVQFAGPVKDAWLDRLKASGFEPIAYVPSNAYLVRGDAGAGERLMRQMEISAARGESFLQWEGPFLAEHKIHPALVTVIKSQPEEEITVAVQVARNTDARADADVEASMRLASSLLGNPYPVLGFTNLKMRVSAGRIAELAALENVVNVEPWTPPQLFDERAAQIVAGELDSEGKQARGPGYMAWLQARGFASPPDFAIDVTDTGMDRGSLQAGSLHQDFLDAGGQSRIAYARDYTSEQDPGDTQGHGTINLSIAGGASAGAGENMRDSGGYNHGLGVAPFVRLGSSKIFKYLGRFDYLEPYAKLVSEAYASGARISSNSWGATANEYTLESQEYDVLARDAAPGQPGNQEMVICFAAGNGGPGGRIGSPGTGKNLISVGAGENARKGGEDGCFVEDEDADSALDMAYFSSGGYLFDGRVKPDICAPGTHVQGAASQHPEFDGTGVCGTEFGEDPYFPKNQKLYTWSSGTSHSTPIVAGAAALARQFFLNRGEEPSAALVKALLLNTTTYMTGTEAGGDLPHARQGWGLLNIGRAFNSVSKVFINQTRTFNESGQEHVITGEIETAAEPFRVTLAWSDAPGLSPFASWVNNLDLEVVVNGQVYRGNQFKGQASQPGGAPNTKDNVEGVWLPAGTSGVFAVRVRATNVAGDGVPGNGDATDQDFALVIYNARQKDAPVAMLAGLNLSGGADNTADPGESVSMRLTLGNASPVALTGGTGTLTTTTQGVTVTAATADFPSVAQGGAGESLAPFTFNIASNVPCGGAIQFVLEVSSQGSVSRLPFTVDTGNKQALEFFADGVEQGEAKWAHGSLIKKKKKRVDTWTISTRRFRSGASSWFTPNLGQVTDGYLSTTPVQLPADGRDLQLVFYHAFEFEVGGFDGGVIEISTGGDFEDLGAKILEGGYNGRINRIGALSNPLGERDAWVSGRFGQFQRVVVDLSSYAGKTVTVRFRIGTDDSFRGLGWHVDDVFIGGNRVTCAQ